MKLEYPPYILYVASLVAEIRDQSNGEAFRVQSTYLPLLRVKNGNTGGCLDLSAWYKSSLLSKPQEKAYVSQASDLLTYQILTLDANNDRQFLLSLTNNLAGKELNDALISVENTVANAPDNTVFQMNYGWMKKLVTWSSSKSGDPP